MTLLSRALPLTLMLSLAACDEAQTPAASAASEGGAQGLSEQQHPGPCAIEKIGDQGPSEIVVYGYDAKGQVLLEEYDFDGDGQVDRIVAFGYDAVGNRTFEERDKGADGVWDYRVQYNYDASGHLLSERIDRDADGEVDAQRNYNYDGAGHVRSIVYDANLDGTVDTRIQHFYDEEFRLIREEVYHGPSGTPDEVRTYTYDYKGQLVEKVEELSSADHSQVFETSYEYDDAGHLIEVAVDHGGDGFIDETTNYVYTDGELTREIVDKGFDGSADAVKTYSYDEAGNLVSTEIDADADGQIDEQVEQSYNCW